MSYRTILGLVFAAAMTTTAVAQPKKKLKVIAGPWALEDVPTTRAFAARTT